MGNVFQSFFPKKQISMKMKRGNSKNDANEQHKYHHEDYCESKSMEGSNNSNEESMMKRIKITYNDQMNDIVDLHQNYDDHNKFASPFKRDFYPAPHEMLVPLEKYRPRRSNIRRSARQNALKAINNLGIPQSTTEDNHFDKLKYDELTDGYEATNKKVEEKFDEETVDKLDPSERTKVARSKISEMLRRQQQIPSINNQPKYISVFEPSLDYYQSKNEPEFNLDSIRNTNNDGINLSGEENKDQDQLVRRPRKPLLTHGNALLIDELKKRQSHFYESREHHHLVNNNAYTPVESN